MAWPLLVRTVRAAVDSCDPRLPVAAATLGASPGRILCTVTIPLAWRGVVGGATLAWARALSEFGATIVVAGNMPGRTTTIPLAIWSAIQSPTGGSVAPLVAASLLLAGAAIVVSELIIHRRRPPHD